MLQAGWWPHMPCRVLSVTRWKTHGPATTPGTPRGKQSPQSQPPWHGGQGAQQCPLLRHSGQGRGPLACLGDGPPTGTAVSMSSPGCPSSGTYQTESQWRRAPAPGSNSPLQPGSSLAWAASEGPAHGGQGGLGRLRRLRRGCPRGRRQERGKQVPGVPPGFEVLRCAHVTSHLIRHD